MLVVGGGGGSVGLSHGFCLVADNKSSHLLQWSKCCFYLTSQNLEAFAVQSGFCICLFICVLLIMLGQIFCLSPCISGGSNPAPHHSFRCRTSVWNQWMDWNECHRRMILTPRRGYYIDSCWWLEPPSTKWETGIHLVLYQRHRKLIRHFLVITFTVISRGIKKQALTVDSLPPSCSSSRETTHLPH